jgi:hypothetical protein
MQSAYRAFVLNVMPEADFLHEQGEWFRKARYLVSINFAGCQIAHLINRGKATDSLASGMTLV